MHIETDENGFWLIHETGAIPVDDPERLYDSVKGQIGPWLRERDEARRTRPSRRVEEVVALADAVDEHWHSIRSSLYDARTGK